MIQFDFESIATRIISNLRKRSEWADINFWSTNRRLIDAIAEELAYLMQYDEILTLESKWGVARNVSSLLTQCDFFMYTPHRKIGASGWLKLSASADFLSAYPYDVNIPKFSVFSGGGLEFCTDGFNVLEAGNDFTEVHVIQGTPRTFSYTAMGLLSEVIAIPNDSIENTVLDVYVNEILWTRYANVRDMEPGAMGYVVRNRADFSGIRLEFGDGFYGRALSLNDAVWVDYVETKGSGGNVEATGVVNTSVSTFVDSQEQPIIIYCTNETDLAGGLDYEDIDSIRVNAPKSFQSGGRIVSISDYTFALERFTFVGKMMVWGAAEINEDRGNSPDTFLATKDNMVYISALTNSGKNLSASQIASIRAFLNERKAIRDIVSFENPNVIFLHFNIKAFVSNRRLSLNSVSSGIIETIERNFNLRKREFKQHLYQSDYISSIDSVPGVEYHNTVLWLYREFVFTSAYVAEILIDLDNVSRGSVEVWLRNKTIEGSTFERIGLDDGDGGIGDTSKHTFIGSSIDYSVGGVSLIVSSGLEANYTHYECQLRFRLDGNNILLRKRSQILLRGTEEVTVVYL